MNDINDNAIIWCTKLASAFEENIEYKIVTPIQINTC